jgi:hypothetical protein
MSHAGPSDGDILNRQSTGQKQQSGGCNLGAVANVFNRNINYKTHLIKKIE